MSGAAVSTELECYSPPRLPAACWGRGGAGEGWKCRIDPCSFHFSASDTTSLIAPGPPETAKPSLCLWHPGSCWQTGASPSPLRLQASPGTGGHSTGPLLLSQPARLEGHQWLLAWHSQILTSLTLSCSSSSSSRSKSLSDSQMPSKPWKAAGEVATSPAGSGVLGGSRAAPLADVPPKSTNSSQQLDSSPQGSASIIFLH